MAIRKYANEETSARNGGGNLVPSIAVTPKKEVLFMEQWLDVVNFEGLYEISSRGNLRKVIPTGYKNMSLNSYDKDGYVKTSLRKNGQRYYFRVHRLVASTFIENPNDYPVVNHKDGIKDNNSVDNLEWCSVSYNTKHAFDELGRIGHNGGMNKPVDQIDLSTKKVINTYNSITDAGNSVGVTMQAIWNAINNKTVSKNYMWRYSNEGVTTIESHY